MASGKQERLSVFSGKSGKLSKISDKNLAEREKLFKPFRQLATSSPPTAELACPHVCRAKLCPSQGP
ncbi:MAG TPA: hypothetical protein VLA27_05255, partial [Paracoccaceae bacterium]|nr:hypothetical protein [Paracoccaceae bacterium]